MCKVIIDAFDNEEDAVAFTTWLIQKMEASQVRLFTTEGWKTILDDGIDTYSSSKEQKVINITTDTEDDLDD